MSYHLESQSEFEGLSNLLNLIINSGTNTGNYREVLSCLLSIRFDSAHFSRYSAFRGTFLELGGVIAQKGWSRASRVYTDPKDRPTKPSYLRRLTAYPDRPRRHKGLDLESGLDQLAKLVEDLAAKPGLSNLSFVFLRPADLHDQFRPGYVPCPIAGDLKMRRGYLHLNVMFRTIDALTVGYADLYYLRKLQIQILEEARALTSDRRLIAASPGDLNLFLSRAYIPRSVTAGTQQGFRTKVNGVEVARKLVHALDTYSEQ